MPTRNVNLTEHFDRLIEKAVASGRYGNASEMIRDGLRLLELREQQEQAKLKWLRSAVKEGLDQINRGEGTEFRSVGELEAYIDQIGEEVSAELAAERERG